MYINQKLTQEFNLRAEHTKNIVSLIDESNTLPFIARYRKEMTGSIDDQILRELNDRLEYLRNLQKRKEEVTESITAQSKMTPELEDAITATSTLAEIEDIYRPYRPKRRTRATIAMEKGLEPLAKLIFAQNITEGTLEELAAPYINSEKEVNSPEEAIAGAKDIIAEQISDTAEMRKIIRTLLHKDALLTTKGTTEDTSVYELYYEYTEPVSKIPPHRILAINRGEKEGFLKVSIDIEEEKVIEKLNTMFASGVMPDFVNAPFWSTTGGEGKVILKAATEGMLLDLTPYIDKYPNIKKLYEIGVARDFKEFDLNHPDFGGKIYIIPQQTPGENPEDVTNWAYGVYARGDILKELGVNPEEVNTSEKVYELLVKIKEGNFTDTTGRPVIPAGTWHNGWDYNQFLGTWSDYTISDYRQEDGKVIHWIFSKDQQEKLMFMRKLVKEGLLDLEAFSNTDTMAKEKMAVGKIAVFGAQSGMDHFKTTLYTTNPEMKYELLGPLLNKSGKIKTQVEKKGRSGFPAMFLSATTEKADAVLRFIDFCNSEQGWLLAQWGVEGVHYTMENGKPKWIPEMKEKFDNEVNFKRDQGVGYLGGFIGADGKPSLWPVPEEDKTQFDKWQDEYKAKLPIVFIDKVSANYLERDWPGLTDYRTMSRSSGKPSLRRPTRKLSRFWRTSSRNMWKPVFWSLPSMLHRRLPSGTT